MLIIKEKRNRLAEAVNVVEWCMISFLAGMAVMLFFMVWSSNMQG